MEMRAIYVRFGNGLRAFDQLWIKENWNVPSEEPWRP